jgi:hypothetical protein
VALDVNISFKRTPAALASAVVVNDPTNSNAIPIKIAEEDILKTYPWDYVTLTGKLKARYIDFKENGKYHNHRKKITANVKVQDHQVPRPVKEHRTPEGFLQPQHHCRVRPGLHAQKMTPPKTNVTRTSSWPLMDGVVISLSMSSRPV